MPIFKRNSPLHMLRTIIIDDEDHQRLTIRKMLGRYCPEVKIMAEAGSVKSGIDTIKIHKPDLILLDIKMDDGTGFDLLEQLQPIDFKVIFITAFDQYALKAFRFSALDYLLKPLDPDDLVEAVKRASAMDLDGFNIQLNNLKEQLTTENRHLRKIIVKTHDNIHLLQLTEILYCASDGNYTRFHMKEGNEVMVSVSLKVYEEILSESGFFRVHKSFLINLDYIRRFEKADGGFIVLSNEEKIPVASRKRDMLLEIFSKIAG